MKLDSAHSKSVQDIFQSLSTQKNGLSKKEAVARLEKYGRNELPKEEGYPFLKSLLHQVNNLLIYVLVAAAIISYIFDHHVDVYVIVGVIFINIGIGLYHDFKAFKMISSLSKSLKIKCRVIRDGKLKEIPIEELVPGDIVDVRDGDKVPADIRVFEAKELSAIESSLTGESKSVRKNSESLDPDIPLGDRTNILFMSTYIVTGEAKGIVVGTGLDTEIGKITEEIHNIEEEKTLFHQRIEKLTKQMVIIAGITVFLTFTIGMIRGVEIEELLLFTIASLVSGIPEGLPAIVTVVLSIASFRMSKRKAVLRNLPSIETLSTVTTIITDKTGTLTENTMTISKIILPNRKSIEVSGKGWSPEGDFFVGKNIIQINQEDSLIELMRWISVANKGEIVKEKEGYQIIGDPTEVSRAVLSMKAGFDKKQEIKNFEIVDELPYDQERKFRALLAEDKNNKTRRVFIVGGAENVIHSCKIEEKKYYLKEVENYAERGMRMQATAHRDVGKEITSLDNFEFKDFEFTSILGIQDPVRKDVKQAVEKAKKAGIRVIMATGDHKNTAIAVGREVGIARNENYPEALDESELKDLSEEKFIEYVKNVSIFSRLTPLTKLRIAQVLQEEGEIIAMTGDGINDAPALKRADIGISMGIIGTDAAREASDIVLTDDNFASIVNAIEEGRTVFSNIRRTSLYLITTNLAEDVIIVFSIAAGYPLILLPLQILWLNLVTDGTADIALATEHPHQNVLQRPPRKRSDGILSKEHLKFIGSIAIVMVILSVVSFVVVLNKKGIEEARTAAFLVMAFTQNFNTLNMRGMNDSLFKLGAFTNKYVIWNFVLSTMLLVFAVEFPPIANIFSFTTIRVDLLFILFAISSIVFLYGELYKYLFKRDKNQENKL